MARLLFIQIKSKLAENFTIMKNLLFALTISLFTLTAMSQNGQTMPDISLKTIKGQTVNVKDYSKNGKITVISFWATWCKPCIKELANVNEVLDEWKQKYGIELVAVSTDNARNVMKVKPFVDSQGWEFECLLDVNEDLRRAMNTNSIPFTVVLDKTGKIVYTHIGYIEGDEVALEEKLKSIAGK